MKKAFVVLWSVVGGIVALYVVGVAAYSIGKAQAPSQVTAQDQVCQVDAGKLLEYVNTERSRLGAPQLQVDSLLATAAKQRLDHMATEKYFSHKLPDGSEWAKFVRDQGVNATISENLGSNDNTPEQSWQEFKDSSNHYKSLTNPKYTRIGIAAQCTDFVLEKAVDPSDDQYVGNRVTDLTVAILADDEPPKQQEQPQQSTRLKASCFSFPSYPSSRSVSTVCQ